MDYEHVLKDILHGVMDKSYEIESSSLREEEVEYRGPEEDFLELSDEESQKIVMHRDVHFGGSFPIMIHYYEQEEAPGLQEDIFVDRIYELYELEKKMGKNIAPSILTGKEAERVHVFRSLYRQFQELYAVAPPGSTERLIAELFLSDGKWEEVLTTRDSALPLKEEVLISILLNEEFQESLAPAFGTVPQAVARLLGHIQSEKAIQALFATIGCGHFDLEEEVIQALHTIGDKAKRYCMKKAHLSAGRDLERALIALQVFLPDDEVQRCAKELLEHEKRIPHHLKEYLLLLVHEGK